MKTSLRFVVTGALCVSALALTPRPAMAQACDQTLSVGANLASAVTNAANGSTICLNNGNYGTVNFFNINRSDYVTVRSVSEKGATISPQIGNSRFIRFQSLSISGSLINSCSANVQILASTFTTGGLLVNNRGNACPANLNLLVDGNTFGNLGPALFEGRLSVADNDSGTNPMGLTISNNTFGPGCQSDGIQLVGGAGGVTIGPGNVFDGIVQSGPTHCDMIQFYSSGPPSTITGNWFRNGSVVITHHTSAPAGTVFRNNLITNVQQFQVGQSANFLFEHNTVNNLTDVFTINSNSTNAIVQNNIFIGNTRSPSFANAGNGPCNGCTMRSNLYDDAASASGTATIVGTPSFTGGASPTSYAGWQLNTGSPGKNAGNDGKDMGLNVATTTPPPAPPNAVRIIR